MSANTKLRIAFIENVYFRSDIPNLLDFSSFIFYSVGALIVAFLHNNVYTKNS